MRREAACGIAADNLLTGQAHPPLEGQRGSDPQPCFKRGSMVNPVIKAEMDGCYEEMFDDGRVFSNKAEVMEAKTWPSPTAAQLTRTNPMLKAVRWMRIRR